VSLPPITIALAGNPNSGKTTLFNAITGTRQKVGNWPGVTVEKKEGTISKFGCELKIIDLPGTYSLTPFSIEEIIARDYLLDERPDVVIDIIDASNLERSLYLATQLREIDCKVIFALNMADLALAKGIRIDAQKLSELLEVPVVFTVGNKGEGIDRLLEQAVALAKSGTVPPQKRKVRYSHDIEEAVTALRKVLEEKIPGPLPYSPRWTAIKLLENDRIVRERLHRLAGASGAEVFETAEGLRRRVMDRYDDDPEIVTTDERYGFIAGIVKEVQSVSIRRRVDISRNIDLVLTNRFTGFPFFIFFIWAMFQLTFTVGEYPKTWIEGGVGLLAGALDRWMAEGLFKELLLDGVLEGVGSVVVFLPSILILFFCIAIFEDTGYMARAAFLMDKIMHLIGLHGKSFIPMLMGFGCNVPAIMAARTLESEKDRILTILITPFMSCSAKLPVYIMLAGTFFAHRAGNVIFLVYLAGILLSIATGRLLRSTLLRGEDAPFVMELPPYRVPMLKSLLIHMWDRSRMFIRRMGGVILIGSVVVWALAAYPRPGAGDLPAAGTAGVELRGENSHLARTGKWIAPVFRPVGIDWRGSIALLRGSFAKENVVSTLGILYVPKGDPDPDALEKAMRASTLSPLSALSMMVFVLLYIPCLATVTTILRETRSWGWTLFSMGYTTGIAWAASFLVYQGGKALGFA